MSGGTNKLVPLGEVVARLRSVRADCLERQRNNCVIAIERCLTLVRCIPTVTLEEWKPSKPAEKTMAVEPFFRKGVIGREVWRCGECGEEVGRHDKYCRTCGRRLKDD